MSKRILAITLYVALSVLSLFARADTYSLTQIGFIYTTVTGLNNSGQVVGAASFNGSPQHAFVTGTNGIGITDIGINLNGFTSTAYGINDIGTVVGSYVNNAEVPFSTGNSTTLIGDSRAVAINSSGQTVMYFNGAISLGGNNTYSTGINNSGHVVGFSSNGADYHAFITGANGQGINDLGTLGGSTSQAFGINALGQVVGTADTQIADRTTSANSHAFITGTNGLGMTDLGTLGGDTSIANGINIYGEVVGRSSILNSSTSHAFITGVNGIGLTDLNTLITLPNNAYFTNAVAINDVGQILANSSNGNSYLLTSIAPVPEPESYSILLVGLGLMGLVVRRRKNKHS